MLNVELRKNEMIIIGRAVFSFKKNVSKLKIIFLEGPRSKIEKMVLQPSISILNCKI